MFPTLLGLSLLLYFGTAPYPALLDDADSAHAVVAREMLQRGDYVVMFMNGIRYLQKAPLHYWMVAAAYATLGQSEFSTRLPVALAMVGLVLMCYEFGRRFINPTAGFYAGLVACTSMGMFIFTRIMIPEAIYALEFTAAFYLFLRAWTGTLPPRLGYWGASLMIALAVLTRGLVGVVFPVGAIVGFIVAVRGWKRWRELHLFSSIALFLAVAVPWHLIAELRAPGFLWSYFINEHFRRALGTRWPPDYDAVPLWLWWLAHAAWFFPWVIFLPFGLRELPSPRRWGASLSRAEQARLLLFLWAGLIMLFFSIEGGSRMEYYSFGAWPAIALILGIGLEAAERERHRWLPRLQACLAVVGVIAAGVLGYLVWDSRRVQPARDISGLLQTHPNDFYRLSMAHVLDLTPQAFADLRVPALIAAVSLLLALVVSWVLRRRHHPAATLAMTAGMVALFLAANMAYGVFGPHLSSRSLARQINQVLRPQDQIAIYGEFDPGSSIGFYTGRRLLLYNGRTNNGLEFGSHFPDVPPIFLDDATFPALWQTPNRVFLFVPPEQHEQALKRLPPDSTWLFAESGDKAVYVNHPLRDGQPSLAHLGDAQRN